MIAAKATWAAGGRGDRRGRRRKVPVTGAHPTNESITLPSWACAVLAACLLAGCGSGSGSGAAAEPVPDSTPEAACSETAQRSWLLEYMSDRYFWYADLGIPEESAPDIGAYFKSLLYRPIDRYSFSQPTSTYVQFFSEGTRTGYGYTLVFADASQTTLRVRFAEPLSPVGLAGLKRGDTVLSIDGYGPAQIAAGTPGSVSAAGIPRSFTVIDSAGVERSFTVDSATYPISTVPDSGVLQVPGPSGPVKAGYLLYQSFLSTSAAALGAAFKDFAAQGVSELIVDLRYNGGGRVTVARNLASMIGGSGLDGKTFAEFRFNAKHPESNLTLPFTSRVAALPAAPLTGLNRIIVITSPSTASASELVINGLRPFTDVVLIGGTTYGKPYAFQPRGFCGTTYSAVNYEFVNALGEGGFIDGIAPTCAVADDLDHPLGDSNEALLAAALHYIETGACPVEAIGRFPRAAATLPGKEAVFGDQAAEQLILD